MFWDDTSVFYPSDPAHDCFLVSAGRELMEAQLQIKKQHLRSAALSPRKSMLSRRALSSM